MGRRRERNGQGGWLDVEGCVWRDEARAAMSAAVLLHVVVRLERLGEKENLRAVEGLIRAGATCQDLLAVLRKALGLGGERG